ncbi:MAG: phage tail terminator-like protein [Pseudomonadota bacterium]
MSRALIRRAFEDRLNTWAAGRAPALPVAWENAAFDPEPVDMYLMGFLLPGDTTSADLARKNRRFVGLYQVTVVAPLNAGPGAVDAVVAELSELFDPAVPMSISGLQVWISDPLSDGPAIPEPSRYSVPCSIPYLVEAYLP